MSQNDSRVLTALPAPDGYEVDLANPQRIGDVTGYWLTGIGMFLAFGFLSIRVYTKTFITRKFMVEDGLLVFSWVSGLVVQGLLIHLWSIKAVGVHAWEVPLQRYQEFTLLIMVASITYVSTLASAKFSILLLYRQLSKVLWFKISILFLMGVVVCYSIGIACTLIFPCKPIAANWDLSITDGKCIDKAAIYLATAAVNVITDFLILTVPIPLILKLQMPRIRKIGVICLFVVGSATFVTSIVRLVLMIPMVKAMDQTWVVSVPCIWINIEANLVIICVSLPALRQFLKHFAPRLVDDSFHSQNNRRSSRYYKGEGSFGGKRPGFAHIDESNDLEMTSGATVHAGAAEPDHGHEDDGSEKAIWQTKTVTITRHDVSAG